MKPLDCKDKMSLKQLLQGEKAVHSIKVKVISNHNDMSIVGDASSLAVCHNVNIDFQNMKPGQCYQILKPKVKSGNEFVPNEKLKPIKVTNFTVTPKKQELATLQAMMQSTTEKKDMPSDKHSKMMTSFKDIERIPPKTEIKKITAKIITISKDIIGKFGTFWIVKLKDINSEKMDINIYNMRLKTKMSVGYVVDLKMVKVTEFAKDGINLKRLVTTSKSSVDKCSADIENLFIDVPLGDKRLEGKVVAIHDIFPYMSCSQCWKKVETEDSTCCENDSEPNVHDFHCQFYIESTTDEFIEVVHTFRRQTNLSVNTLNQDDIQALLEATFMMKIFTFEWNILDGDEENLRMVKIDQPKEVKKEGGGK